MMLLVITSTAMDRILDELRQAAVSDSVDKEHVGLRVIRSWEATALLLADERSRTMYWWPEAQPEAAVVKAMDRGGRALATWLASIGRDGYARERAVMRLALDPEAAAGRLIALRVGDPVEQVRVRAWKALEARLDSEQALAIGPVLLRLSGRLRAAAAITRYAAMFSEHQRKPLWGVLLDNPDRDMRRWAFASALRSGGIDPHEAVQLLRHERDQWVAGRLAGSVIGSVDLAAMKQLLTSRHAVARALAIGSLPDGALPDAAIEGGLFDRAAKVREAAKYRASNRGLDARPIYRRAWEEGHDPRALRGAAECGEKFAPGDLRIYASDPDPRVRATAVELLAGEDLDRSDVELLFGLLDDPDPGPAGMAVRALTAHDASWPYQQAATLWATPNVGKRRRVWRLLSRRGGWDRVRADLLAISDPDLEISNQGRFDLEAWRQFAAARMWHRPTADQYDEIIDALTRTQVGQKVREAIEFRLGFRPAASGEM